ncbi:MAG: NAD-dependent DNA ligase LigA [Defluviitaleaceae bacterium]|nr:NAD-dependent DNA ligase LigA [Defluviitaleaceae bacterium]
MSEKILRINELTAILNAEIKLYYTAGESGMADIEYDKLMDELARLEDETGHRLPNSPVGRVGFDVMQTSTAALQKVTHISPMLSLNKTKDVGEMLGFIGVQDVLVSYKLDGMAVELTYVDGVLQRAATRGNGTVGENITHNALKFVNIPHTLSFKDEIRIRGEAIITFPDFEKINAALSEDEEKYKNPRNLTAGTVRQLETADIEGGQRELRDCVRFYALSAADNNVPGMGFVKKSEILDFIESLGFEVSPYTVTDADSFMEILEGKRSAIEALDYATDGLVVVYNDIMYSNMVGQTAKYPRDALAFKWADEEAETSLVGVEWNTSRTGLINPVAVFAPVEIEGTTVSRASLHNVSIFEGFNFGVGDRVLVYKANMIIPQVSKNLYGSGGLAPPAACPACGAQTEVRDKDGIKTLHCINHDCKARVLGRLVHFVSRNCMNIEGLSEQTIARLHELGILDTYADFFTLKDHRDMLVGLKGFGRQSVDKLLEAINRAATCKLHDFIAALGIVNLGKEYAKALAAYFDNDLNKITSATADEMAAIHGFGDTVADGVYTYFNAQRNIDILNRALPNLIWVESDAAITGGGALSGKTFVITGKLTDFPNRNALVEYIEKAGGKTTSTVSANTDYLINNDASSTSGKNKKARELGVSVITEAEFLDKFTQI